MCALRGVFLSVHVRAELMSIRTPRPPIRCRPVADAAELLQCLAIRARVFVDEQGLFLQTDRDRHDAGAIHLLAEQGGAIVGTVRVYRFKGRWWGGRLAVLRSVRGRAGKLLVRHAVETARGCGAERLYANVQQQNVAFFLKLGWQPDGDPFVMNDTPHQRLFTVTADV